MARSKREGLTSKQMITGYDFSTLRELVDVPAVEARLAELGDTRSTSALGEKAELYRLLGRLDEALTFAEQAFRLEHFGGDRERLTAARLRRAQVFQYQGQRDRALGEMTAARATATLEGWQLLEAQAAQQEGTVLFELGRLDEARDAIAHALQLRKRIGAPVDQIDTSNFALEVVNHRMLGRD